MSKKYSSNFILDQIEEVNSNYFFMKLKHPGKMPEVSAGQFLQVELPDAASSFLRRPISIHDVDYTDNTLHLLVRIAGNGTLLLSKLKVGSSINVLYPLGNGFCIDKLGKTPLLIGGGVGVAPMLYLAKQLSKNGVKPTFLFGARTQKDLLRIEEFAKYGNVFTTTEDGSGDKSVDVKGFVTNHPELFNEEYSAFAVCGPMPMMKAVAQNVKKFNKPCFVSLENKMACGIGACLCCVTENKEGHNVCVCTDGPVFEIGQLGW